MAEMFVIYLFGFPGAFLSLIISVFALLKKKVWFLLFGGLLFLPFCFYLNATPNFKGSIFLFLFYIGSMYALSKNKNVLAWALFLPIASFTIFVAVIVLIGSLSN